MLHYRVDVWDPKKSTNKYRITTQRERSVCMTFNEKYIKKLSWSCDGMNHSESITLGGNTRVWKIAYDTKKKSNSKRCDTRSPCKDSPAHLGIIKFFTQKKHNDGAKKTKVNETSVFCECNTGKEW